MLYSQAAFWRGSPGVGSTRGHVAAGGDSDSAANDSDADSTLRSAGTRLQSRTNVLLSLDEAPIKKENKKKQTKIKHKHK